LVQQWIEDAKKCEIPELKAFAVMLFQDMEAMVAAIVMPAGKARQRAG
jgi:transposase